MSSREKIPKVIPPLAAAAGGAAVGSYLRGRKARRQGQIITKFARAANARAERQQTENQQLRHEVAHDDLTGLQTKKAFIAKGNKRLSRARPDQVFALALFDLDNFKAINDNHPDKYDEGDRTLQNVADVLLENVRRDDKSSPDLLAHGSREDSSQTARLGGDEFAGLFDVTPRDERGMAMSPIERAGIFCDRIRTGVINRFQDRADIQELGGLDVSIGVVIREPGEMIESMLSRAATEMGHIKNEHHTQNGVYRS
jgi:GGDEF domain-containing protein